MERLIRLRATVRSSFTRIFNTLKEELNKEDPDRNAIQVSMTLFERKATELTELDEKVMELAVEEKDATELEQEGTIADEYQKNFLDLKLRVSQLLTIAPTTLDISTTSAASLRKFRLPKLEFRRFGGDVKDWLPFWSQFEKIDQDSEIAAEDKFQYLLQATIPESRAREVVESFPPTAANYPKAIQCLKARFGKEDVLVEVYVRELLKLVLQNAVQNKAHASMLAVYDRLETHLRALETLGVTTDKCASMLYPLVESCLPEEILRAWQRSTDVGEVNDPSQRLGKLMKFLRLEVENEERIKLAMSGFGIKNEKRPTQKRCESSPVEERFATAAGLLATTSARNSKLCVFCSGQHNSADCFTAQKMSLEEKRKHLKDKGCCFGCLRTGHGFRKCKAAIKCHLCGKKHVVLMCPQLQEKGHRDTSSKLQENETEKSSIAEVLTKL